MDDDFERDDSDFLGWMDYVPEFADITYPRKRVPGIQAEINNLAKHLNLAELSSGQIRFCWRHGTTTVLKFRLARRRNSFLRFFWKRA